MPGRKTKAYFVYICLIFDGKLTKVNILEWIQSMIFDALLRKELKINKFITDMLEGVEPLSKVCS